MNIVIIQDYLRCGGTETQSIALAHFFAQKQAQVTLLTARPGGVLRKTVSEQVATRVLQPFDTHMNFWFPRLESELKALQPDGVLLMGRMANGLGQRIKKTVPQAKLIATMRSGQRLPKANYETFKQAEHVAVNSQWAADFLLRDGVSQDKLIVINNGLSKAFDLSSYDAERLRIREKLNATDATFVMLNVASFSKGKGQSELFEVIKHFKGVRDWQLWLVGQGPELKRCQAMVQQMGLEKHILFLGYQSDPFPYYAGADVLVLTSQRESQPNALVEAQAVGLPVVSHDVAGARECFVDRQSGYLLPFNDYQGIAAALGKLAENREVLDEMKAPARAWAKRCFDPVQNNEKYWSLFH